MSGGTVERSRQGPSVWTVVALLALFLAVEHGRAITAPFFSDDYIFLDKLRGASFRAVWEPKDLAYHWYRPWSRELYYWIFVRLFGLNAIPYHLACFTLWLATMGLYFSFLARVAGRAVAGLATAGVASLALWVLPLEWGPGVQDLWMLFFALLALHAWRRRRTGWAMLTLALALLSKETAAVLPAIAFGYSLTVEKSGVRETLRRVAPLAVLVAVWAALHPALGGRLWEPQHFAPLPGARTPAVQSWRNYLLALINLDLPLSPVRGWGPALRASLPGALILGFLAVRAAMVRESAPGSSRPDAARVALFGVSWALIAWLPFLFPSVLWQPYYAAFGALGAWMTIALLPQRVRWLAVPVIVALALLRGPRAETPSRDWGNVVLQRFGRTFMSRTESYLKDRLPVLPRHARLFFTSVPRGVVFITGRDDAPALRTWYDDKTLSGSFWGDFHRRDARDSVGPDYFFRYDSLSGWIEVRTGPEDLVAAPVANPRWREDHQRLARTLIEGGDLRAATVELQKLAVAHPEEPNYPWLLGTCLEDLGARDSAGIWYARAAALPGATDEIRETARGFARQSRTR
jgi:hypothetical protein